VVIMRVGDSEPTDGKVSHSQWIHGSGGAVDNATGAVELRNCSPVVKTRLVQTQPVPLRFILMTVTRPEGIKASESCLSERYAAESNMK
jgi:hypothetical protein